MSGNMQRVLCLLLLAGAAGLPGGPVLGRQAKPSHEKLIALGVLTCSLTGSNAGAQSRDMLCRFRLGSQGSEEVYAGTVQGVGRTQTLYGKGTIMLAVKGPASTEFVPGLLQQVYSAEASPVSAAAPLTGTTNAALVLQPLMEEEGRVAAGKTRPDAAIIMLELRLKASPA